MKYLFFLFLFFFFMLSSPILAQDNVITQDDINEVAERMYCPVCENVPLDDCATATCLQWKQEIGDLLTQGKTSDEIINIFVAKYGEKVVGVPQDPVLRALSLVTPILGALLGILLGIITFTRWQKNKREFEADMPLTSSNLAVDDDYRAKLERDLL